MLSDRGIFGEAKALFRESLAKQRKAFGIAHPGTYYAMTNLAIVLPLAVERRAKHSEAEPLYREALAAQRKARGEAHPATLRTSVQAR